MIVAWLLWALSVLLTLLGVDIVQVYPTDSRGEFIGYLFIGFGLLAMLNAGKAMRE